MKSVCFSIWWLFNAYIFCLYACPCTMCVPGTYGSQRGHWIPCTCSYSVLWVSMWALEVELRSLARVASGLKCWAISRPHSETQANRIDRISFLITCQYWVWPWVAQFTSLHFFFWRHTTGLCIIVLSLQNCGGWDVIYKVYHHCQAWWIMVLTLLYARGPSNTNP